MPVWGWFLVVGAAVALALVAHLRGWIDLSDKSRRGGVGGGLIGGVDEVFFPTRHEAQVELDRQTILPAPAPTPGEGPNGIVDAPAESPSYRGRLRLDVPADR